MRWCERKTPSCVLVLHMGVTGIRARTGVGVRLVGSQHLQDKEKADFHSIRLIHWTRGLRSMDSGVLFSIESNQGHKSYAFLLPSLAFSIIRIGQGLARSVLG